MAERIELAVPAAGEVERELPERLPIPIAAAVIVLLSAGLWAGIIGLVRLILG